MGVIDVSDNQGHGESQDQEVKGKKKSDWKPINWDDIDKVESDIKSLDRDANFNEKLPVPRKAVIGFKMRIADYKNDVSMNDKGEFNIRLDCEIVECVTYPDRTEEEYKGFRFDYYLSTAVPRGKRISSLGFLIAKYSKADFKAIPDKDLVKGLASLLSKEPTLYGLWNWKGSYRQTNGEWVNKYWDMDEFPTGKDGEKERRVQVGQYQISAQGQLSELYGKRENIPVAGAKRGAKGASTVQTQTQTQVKDPEPKNVKVEDVKTQEKAKEKDSGAFDDLEL